MVLDGSDNFATRFLVNDACFFAKKTLISASMFRFEGQLTTIKPHAGYPCYRCLYPEPPPAGLVPNCQEAGVLGALAGTMGILQASEAIKEILGIGETLADRSADLRCSGDEIQKSRHAPKTRPAASAGQHRRSPI